MKGFFRLLTPAVLLLGGCATIDRWTYPTTLVEVSESARTQQCGTSDMQPQLTWLRDRAAVEALQTQRGIQLRGSELPATSFVLLEMGQYGTSGYGIAVSRAATLRKNWLTLRATFVTPPPDSVSADVVTSPCVLVSLPAGDWLGVMVLDQKGSVRASTPIAHHVQ